MERLAASVFLPRASASVGLAVWSAAAILSVLVASSIAVQPGFLADLSSVRAWLTVWQSGSNPYDVFPDLDYPPNAFLLLWPVAFVGDSTVPAIFLPLAIAATAAGTWLMSGWMARQFGLDLPPRDRVVLVLLMLAGSSLRGALWRGQTAPFALLFGAAALHSADRRPGLATMALACCAFKPHVALGFGLAMVATIGWQIPALAALAALGSSVVFALHTNTALLTGWQQYIGVLRRLYDGPDQLRGLLSVRWIVEDAIGSYEAGTIIYCCIAVATAGFLINAARTARAQGYRAQVAAALMLWTLLFLPHQLYHGWMAAPALWLMMWPEAGLFHNHRVRLWTVAAFVTFGVVDVPRLMRLVVDPSVDAFGWISYAASPLRLVAIFTLFLSAIGRPRENAALAVEDRAAA